MVSTDGTHPVETPDVESDPAVVDENSVADNGQAVEDQSVVEGTATAVAPIEPGVPSRKKRKSRPSRIDRQVMEFQPDVVELEHKKVPGGARWTLYVSILLIVSAISWACWAEVDRIVECEGELVPLDKPVLIQPLVAGRILELHADFNDPVFPGDLLVTLDPTYSQADVDKYEKQLDGLKGRMERLKAELDGRDFDISNHPSWEAERITFMERKARMESEVKRLDAERQKILVQQQANESNIKVREGVVDVFKKQLETERELARNGTTSVRDYESALIRYEDANLQLSLAVNQRGEFVEDLNVNERTKVSFVAESRSTTSDLLVQAQQEFNTVTEELNKARHAVSNSKLYVPEDYGDVEFIVLQQSEVAIGSVVEPGTAVYRLMPRNTKYELKVNIDGKDVARLRSDRVEEPTRETDYGDQVRVKLASFPFQRHGTLDGRVRAISEGTFQDGEGVAQRMIYQGRIRLLTTDLDDVPEDFRLLPGMQCTAEIKIGRRRVIDYFLYPLFRYLDGSIREP